MFIVNYDSEEMGENCFSDHRHNYRWLYNYINLIFSDQKLNHLIWRAKFAKMQGRASLSNHFETLSLK